ncbi:MAG: hypothetical protein ABSH28_17390 [Acidobacteriota bacterium]|jgi:hypothetical protein
MSYEECPKCRYNLECACHEAWRQHHEDSFEIECPNCGVKLAIEVEMTPDFWCREAKAKEDHGGSYPLAAAL